MSDENNGAPALGASGQRLWDDLTFRFSLDEGETALLVQACRTVDSLDTLEAAVAADGVVIETPQGQRAHPALVEARQQRITLARLVSALRVPDDGAEDDGEGARRPQRRTGVRQPYRLQVQQ